MHFLSLIQDGFPSVDSEGLRGQSADCNMHDEDGGEAAESMAETRRVEAAAGCAAELSDVSNPSIKPAFPQEAPLFSPVTGEICDFK